MSYALLEFNWKGQAGQIVKIPIVTSISMTATATLSEAKTYIYGYKQNFCMDTGTALRINLSCMRVNPIDYSDSKTASMDKWSNAVWFRNLESLLDNWQNNGMEGNVRAGGFHVKYFSDDEALYPNFDYNVFLSGSLGLTYDTDTIKFSLPLAVARMNGEGGTVPTVTLTLKSNVPSLESTITVSKGYYMEVPSEPDGWLSEKPGFIVKGWDTSPDATTVVYEKGSYVVWNSNTTLYAVWGGVKDIRVWNIGDEAKYIVQDKSAYITAYLVGGGGGSGRPANKGLYPKTVSRWKGLCIPGGAGGSGYVNILNFSVSEGDIITADVGKGGAAGINKYNHGNHVAAEDGGRTTMYKNGAIMGYANGGSAGKQSDLAYEQTTSEITYVSYPGAGGSKEYAGGSSPSSTGGKGTDGSTTSVAASAGTVGKGSIGYTWSHSGSSSSLNNGDLDCRGGGGGAAAGLNLTLYDNTGIYGTYTSRGGDGFNIGDNVDDDPMAFHDIVFWRSDLPESANGTIGGGGGGGCTCNYGGYPTTGQHWMEMWGGKGGDGIVILVVRDE